MKKAPLLTTAAMALVLQLEAQISGPVKMTAAEFAKKISDITGSTTPKTNQNDSVAIWPHEMQEFSKHVEGAKSPRFTPEEQAENIKASSNTGLNVKQKSLIVRPKTQKKFGKRLPITKPGMT